MPNTNSLLCLAERMYRWAMNEADEHSYNDALNMVDDILYLLGYSIAEVIQIKMNWFV